MPFNDSSPDQHDNVTSAARVTASWARARRAAWTSAPLALLTTAPERRPSRATIAPLPGPDRAAPAPFHAPPPADSAETGPSRVARAAEQVRALGAPLARWLPHAVAAVVVGSVVVTGGRYLWNAVASKPARTATSAPAAVRPQVLKRKLAGGLRVISTPAGAQVLVDGKARGVTPLTIPDLSVGRHEVEIKSVAGTIERTVTIAADKTAEIDESIFSGWVAVHSPFDLVVTEGGRALLMDDRRQIMLPPGRHVLRFVNRAVAYDAVRQVVLKPGEVTSVTVAPPPSTMTVTASEAAEVWLDGTRVGETPLNALPVPLGTHEIVVKRAAGGERRFTVTVTVNPFTLLVDFSRPAG